MPGVIYVWVNHPSCVGSDRWIGISPPGVKEVVETDLKVWRMHQLLGGDEKHTSEPVEALLRPDNPSLLVCATPTNQEAAFSTALNHRQTRSG